MNLYLLNYNNYYNKIVKKSDTLEAYILNNDYAVFFNVNFNPNDNVSTHIVLNWEESFDPDYLIAHDETTGKMTRWFVIDMKRERLNQYSFRLRRDLLADYYEDILLADSFIEKGYVPSTNKLIYNPEGVSVNQIKTKEYLLKDKTKCGWIVGYLAKNLGEEGALTVDVTYPQDNIPDISTFGYNEYIGKTITGFVDKEQSYIVTLINNLNYAPFKTQIFFDNTAVENNDLLTIPATNLQVFNITPKDFNNLHFNLNFNVFNNVLENNVGNSIYTDILALNNKVYKDGDTYKKVSLTTVQTKYLDINIPFSEYPNIKQEIYNEFQRLGLQISSTSQGVATRLYYSDVVVRMEEVSAPFTQASITFEANNRSLYDAPYKMFCIPVSEDIKLKVGDDVVSINREKVLQIATSIGAGLKSGADGFVYDIQLLPYCPISDSFDLEDNVLTYLYPTNEDFDYSIMKDSGDQAIGFVFYAPRSNFSFNISDFPSDLLPQLTSDAVEFKVRNETTMTRLCSPNFANQDNFNVFMNFGVNWFNVDCTYKPFTPYIKVNINYKNMYGGDYNDNRGLILGGDFSIPLISDAWTNYQIQNKNYSNIFDRETQHLEYQQGWNLASSITGAMLGGGAGALLGGKLFGKKGAIGGGIGALATGAVDVASNIAMFGENMDYRRDMFDMQLQNIQALPQGIVKSSAFNYNSKIFPFVEVYECSAEEKDLVRNKIKYSGMSLGIIGKIVNYKSQKQESYIQARLIRLETLKEDTHIVSEINRELNGGVYYE